MTELSFAKSFLSTLDSRSVKLQADYVADPKTFEPKGPYTLPRMPNPMRKPTANPASGSTPALTISLKSLRNPPLSLSLSSQPYSTSIHELKTALAKHIGAEGGAIGNIRILYKKKPCPDSRTVKEVIGDDKIDGEIEFSVMIMGGLATAAAAQNEERLRVEEEKPPVVQGPSGQEVVEREEFWEDLNRFLGQRIRDEGKAEEVLDIFRAGWKKRGGG